MKWLTGEGVFGGRLVVVGVVVGFLCGVAVAAAVSDGHLEVGAGESGVSLRLDSECED